MVRNVLLVDLENIQKMDLGQVPHDAHVMVFYGVTQKKLPEELVVQAQPLGARLSWIKISGTGPNALDFHIAYYLGREYAQHRDSHCAILSSDLGFEPLVKHLQAQGHHCRRVAALKDAFPSARSGAAATDPFDRLLALLRKEKSLPSKPKGLEGKIKNWFPNLSAADRQALRQRLLAEGRVRDASGSLSYHLGN
ncbi:MAG: hypothetical protein JSR54_03020 [Proteobacteria bacterium]|nr:hypothetical protein [Pseudomonadota bacterium]